MTFSDFGEKNSVFLYNLAEMICPYLFMAALQQSKEKVMFQMMTIR